VMIGPHCLKDIAALRKPAESAGVRIAGVKFMTPARWDQELLVRTVRDAREHGADCAFHVTEVEELDAALNACERGLPRIGTASEFAVCRVEHGGLIPPEYPERIAALGCWVVTNPGFIYYRGAKYAGDPGLVPFLYRGKSLLAAGIKLAGGTDAPVTPAKPLYAIAAAVERISLEGYELAPPEGIAVETAFALFTRAAAELSRLSAGEITLDGLADLIVLPADPIKLHAAELMNLAVDMTIVGGRVVYERGRPLKSQAAAVSMVSS
jgi:predicted amidohydrolase YtcJ